jgi:hypothetical protein
MPLMRPKDIHIQVSVPGGDLLIGSNATSVASSGLSTDLEARAECKAIKVDADDNCTKLSVRCSIRGTYFIKYNAGKMTNAAYCNSLKAGQLVCCSSGTLPDNKPKPDSKGTCFTTKINTGDTCFDLGAPCGLNADDIAGFNKNS